MNFENDILNCLRVLRDGGTILYPTDTIWGVGCDATNEAAVEKIFDLKKRPAEKSLIVLVADERQVLQHVASPDLAVFDWLKNNPGPTTVIYDGAIGLADNLVADDGTIAIRICSDNFCKQLVRRFGKPIVSTSANISGQISPRNFSEISSEIKNTVDYVVTFKQTEMKPVKPSSIIRWNLDGTIVKIR